MDVPATIRELVRDPDKKMPFSDAYPFAVATDYPCVDERVLHFDFEGIERQYFEMIAWATDRFGPPRNDGLEDALWAHRVDYFRFKETRHAIEFKLRWG